MNRTLLWLIILQMHMDPESDWVVDENRLRGFHFCRPCSSAEGYFLALGIAPDRHQACRSCFGLVDAYIAIFLSK